MSCGDCFFRVQKQIQQVLPTCQEDLTNQTQLVLALKPEKTEIKSEAYIFYNLPTTYVQ